MTYQSDEVAKRKSYFICSHVDNLILYELCEDKIHYLTLSFLPSFIKYSTFGCQLNKKFLHIVTISIYT